METPRLEPALPPDLVEPEPHHTLLFPATIKPTPQIPLMPATDRVANLASWRILDGQHRIRSFDPGA